jgi:transcriptional regulator with XRE-family HTH domain
MVTAKTISKNIRYWRNFRGLKQSYVADQIEVSSRWYIDLENGKANFKIDQLLAIARVLEVEPAELFKEVDHSHVKSSGLENQENLEEIVQKIVLDALGNLLKKIEPL